LIINQRFGNKKLFTRADDFDLMMFVDSNLMKKYPDNSHVLAHHQWVGKIVEEQKQQQEANAKLAPGMSAPNLNLPDPSGRQISLNSLKGKYVLLFFWKSYSPPCRADIQNLKKMYHRYKPEGFEVYAVSFDHNRKVWADVVKTENLNWINVSDLLGDRSPVKKLYNLKDELPYYYLISKKGKIISKGERILNIEQVIKI
jgi:peroxiredoxin